jgi:hypothetical protein
VENGVDGTGVVFHIEPVTDVFPFAVNGEGFAVADIVDEEEG